jgi:hypothetical protein
MRSGSKFILVVKTKVEDPGAQVEALASGSGKQLALLGSDVVNKNGQTVTLIKIRVN